MNTAELERAILQTLATLGDNYALGLGALLHTNQTMYAVLWDMELRGLLTSYERDAGMPERGDRPRRFYSLTDKARERLRMEAMT